LPVIAPVKSVPRLVVVKDFSGHGFRIGPAAGQLTANLVAGERPIVDPAALRFERYSN
jgi:glycine/D-amino acid oxidase-like deaminating enzyme